MEGLDLQFPFKHLGGFRLGYHLLVPVLPGYDFENDSDFTSVEQIASDLNEWLKTEGYTQLMMIGRTG